MFYYIRTRKKGTAELKSAREDGRILVFSSPEAAKKYADEMKDFACSVATIQCHPSHKKSPIHGKKYKKVGW